jgi:spore germination cell wall hydrolase CwlJ-like protein
MKCIIIMAAITMAAFAQAQFTLKELVDAYNAEADVQAIGEVIEVRDSRLSEVQKTANAIARTLWAEARSEGEFGIRLVASVIYNRADGNPAKMYGVVTKPKQFTC